MSRIRDAMERAGQTGPENTTGPGADPGFLAGEDSAREPEVGTGSSSEAESMSRVTLTTALNAVPLGSQPSGIVPRIPALPMQLHSAPPREEIEIREVLRMLRSRWRLILAIVAVSAGLAITYNSLAQPIYEARARVVIEPDSNQVVPFRPVAEDTSRNDYFGTQLDVLRSRDLARQTLDHLQLLSKNPAVQSAQIGELLSTLVVAPVRNDVGSRTVNIAIRLPDPELAARMANGLAQTYVDQNLELRRQGSREAAKWLTERLAELRQEVTSTAGALQQYREEKDAVSLDDKQNIVVQKLSQLNGAVTSVRAEKVEKQAVYQQLTALQGRGAPLDTFPPILANGFIQSLKAELATLQRNRQQMSERLGDLHPDMVKIDSEIATAERKLNEEISKVVEGIRNEYKTAEAREQGLVAALEQQKREVLDLNQKAIAYGALQRDASSTQQIFDGVLQRLKEAELSAELQSNNVRILETAIVPRIAIWPRTDLNLAIALIMGGFLAIGLAFVLEFMNPRIKHAHDIANSLGLPLLGLAPQIDAFKKGSLHVDALPGLFQEAIRSIRTRLMLSPAHGELRTLAVTSTVPREGKTVVATSLAASIAMTGRRVLLVDGDLRRPQVHKIFGVGVSPGLSNVLGGQARPSEALIESSVRGLYLMPAGDRSATPADLLDTEAVSQLVHGLSQVFDVVVLDCPPVMALADASIVANAASSVLFVVASGTTTAEAARAAIDRLSSVQAQIVGVVLNNAKVSRNSDYGYDYYDVQEAV